MVLAIVVWVSLGLILGSFANVLILREETGETLGGRSHCPHCARTLLWYELFPVLSFFLLRGRCRTCAGAISWQYPLVEALMAAFVLAIGLAPVPLIGKIIGIPIALLLVCIAVYDFRTTYIPDRWVYSLALLTFVYAFASSSVLAPWYVVLLSGPVVALPLYLLWLVSAGAWMGLGDAKLALGFGWLLGIVGGYLALGLAFVLGAVVGCTLIGITRFAAAGRGFTMKSEVPFGPFLILSLCIVWCSQLYGLGLLVALARFLSLS